jgi:adenosylhomocysteine nucleosidase
LAAEFGAIACDMETMAVAQVCRRRHVRFLAVRVISDGLDDRLPPEMERMLDQRSLAGKLGAATRAIFQRPGSVKDMWRLQETARRASDRLANFLAGVIPQLLESDGSG